MKELLERGEYETLNQKLDVKGDSKRPEDKLIEGIVFEFGLGKEIDIEKAESSYLASFNKNNLQAGLYLAKLYLKNFKNEEAEKIYKKIIEKDTSEEAESVYAKYQLLKFNSYKLIHTPEAQIVISSLEVQTPGISENVANKLKKLASKVKETKIELPNSISGTIKSYEELLQKYINPSSPLYAEIITQREEMAFFLNEQNISTEMKRVVDINYKEKDLFTKEKNNKNFLEYASTKINNKKLELEKVRQELLANKLDVKSIESLLACLIITDAITKSTIKNTSKELHEARIISKNSLEKDPNNLTLLTKRYELLQHLVQKENTLNENYLNESHDILKKIININPHDLMAKKRLKESELKIVRLIAKEISTELQAKLGYLKNIKKSDKTRINQNIESISLTIANNLESCDYITQKSNFQNIKDNAKEIANDLFLKYATKIINNDIETRDINTSISNWNDKKNSKHDYNLTDSERSNIRKREEFKKKTVRNLMKYYGRCKALTEEGSDLDVRLKDSWASYASHTAEAILPIAAAATGSYATAITGTIFKGIRTLSEEQQKSDLKRVAEKYASIGDRDLIKAQESFEYIANKIVEQYGSQIDNIVADDIDKLAKVATEKMLDHLANPKIASEAYNYIKDPKKFFRDFFNYMNQETENIEQPAENMLFEGLVNGTAHAEIDIKTIRDGDNQKSWNASKVFEKPLLTIDGQTFYCKHNELKEANTYGACFSDKIPESYTEKEVSSIEKTKLQDAFYINQKLINSSELRDGEYYPSLEEKTKLESEISSKSEDKLSRVFEIAKALAGVVLVTAAAVAIAGSIITGAAVPIIIGSATVTGAIGLVAVYSGGSNALKLSNKINKYELENKSDKFEELAKIKAQKERTKIFEKEYNQLKLKNQVITTKNQEIQNKWFNAVSLSKQNMERGA